MKKITILSFFCIAFFCQEATAQSWSKAIGIRLGYPTSITYKQFVSEKAAVEGIVGTRGFSGFRTFNVAAAFQIHNSLLEDNFGGLRWYYGAGAGLTTYNFKDSFVGLEGGSSFAIQGYLGVDYTFEDVPVNISLDWVPNFFLNGFGNGFSGDYGSLAVRYIF